MERIQSFIMVMYYKTVSLYVNVKRSLEFAKFGYDNHDWDHERLLDLMNFKMTRMYDRFLKEEIFLHPKKEFKSLRICLKLYKKRNLRRNIENVYKRWGDPEIKTESIGTLSHLIVYHSKANTPELKKILDREISSAHIADQARELRNEQLYFKIFQKYHKTWRS